MTSFPLAPIESVRVITTGATAGVLKGIIDVVREDANGAGDDAGLELGTGVEDTDGVGDVTATRTEADEAEDPPPPPPPPPPLVATAVEEAHVPDGVVLICICVPALALKEWVILDSVESQIVSMLRVLERVRFDES